MKFNSSLVHRGKRFEISILFVGMILTFLSTILLALILKGVLYLILLNFTLLFFLTLYLSASYYFILNSKIIIKYTFPKRIVEIYFSNIAYVYHHGNDGLLKFNERFLRLYDNSGNHIYSLSFNEPDCIDIIKVLKYFKLKGVKLKIDKKYTDSRIITALNEE